MPIFYPNKSFTLSGTNLNFVEGISFGEQKVTTFFHLGSTGISGNIPAAAMSGELFYKLGNHKSGFRFKFAGYRGAFREL